ncbi:serine phosphatase RsbU (regulator of sigma subunit) [Nonomuraea polychroma]|uniref:protein-serine/threonine phosphatase n=1 Tax=Nonomuraea polychroma TaxID=46176 RepID=A0A438M7U4_9ACTN|nr:GAF domain-containing SpoIIE family protein phosphatase [Nonomuraea polychroma]RVX41776.1 serine phosphatase RsbU (regulator of sigma subunit) [Nonomuraea polychroma]
MKPGFLIKDPRSRARLRLSGASTTQERLAFLNDASTRIGSTLDLEQTCREVLDVAVPRFADTGGIMVQERLITEGEFPVRPTDGTALVRRVATAVAAENPWDWDTAFPVGEVVVYPPHLPQGQAMATAKTVLVPRLPQSVGDDHTKAFGREIIAKLLPGCSFLVAPLLARGNVLGFFVLLRQAVSEPFQEADVALVEELAARTAICIDNARLYSRERRTALMLQSSLLPRCLKTPPWLEVAYRYLPASDLAGVGGDWFDVISLSGDRTALVVGDVMGHGVRAAATMGQLRTATQTLASLDLDPPELLFRLNRVAQQLDSDQIATCVYARYDRAAGTLQIASAGHLPPVLVQPAGVAGRLPVLPGPPLGIGAEPYEMYETALPAGAMLALYTDGLVEGREWNIDEGLDKLCALLTGPPLGIDRICDMIVRAQCPNSERDDIALLLAKAV